MLRSETGEDPVRMSAALAGLKAYQQALRCTETRPMPEIARAGRATLRDYGGRGPIALFVPSLINPPDVLDLDEDRSLLRWLAGQGVRPMLLDWGTPGSDERALTIAGHVETMLLPLLDALGEPVHLAGYCLGGTMALAAAARRPVRSLTTIAAPWRFAAYPSEMQAELGLLWEGATPAAEALGLLPMEVLQAAFWRLDPARTIAKYEAFGRRDSADPSARTFVRLEDWANDGPPLTLAAAQELFFDLYKADLTGQGAWQVAGAPVDLASIMAPILEIVSTTDRIVPAAATPGLVAPLAVALGHVGMIVGSRARSQLWEPLAAWLSQVRTS
jgi:polyhydroxyalkanoate synthase